MPWNHNIHYHNFILSKIPSFCRTALDVGCGYGAVADKMRYFCNEVTAIDSDDVAVQSAKLTYGANGRIKFIKGDFILHEFAEDKFDFVTTVATLHHLPLEAALLRLKSLVAKNGKLVVIGLYQPVTIVDSWHALIAFPVSRLIKLFYKDDILQASIKHPKESLKVIKLAVQRILPDAVIKRRFFYRYSIVWQHNSI